MTIWWRAMSGLDRQFLIVTGRFAQNLSKSVLKIFFPRVLPWADCCWPLDKSLMLGILIASYRLLLLYRDFQTDVFFLTFCWIFCWIFIGF